MYARWLESGLAFLLSGLGLGMLEGLVVVAFDRELFLAPTEWLLVLVATCSVHGLLLSALGTTTGAAFGPLRRRLGLQRALALLCAGSTVPIYFCLAELTAGRRVRAVPLRLWLVLAGALAAGGGLFLALRWIVPKLESGATLRGRRARSAGLLALLLLSAGCIVTDSQVLRRLYPAFHLALAAGALLSALLIGHGLRAPVQRLSRVSSTWLATGLFLLIAMLATESLSRAPNARFATETAAPLLGKYLQFQLPALMAPERSSDLVQTAEREQPEEVAGASAVRPQLRGRDVLLITVDALRADRLRAYGGEGLTKSLDTLAEQGVVFERAYTTTPHTSYAMTSLLTGKYLRELSRLPGDGRSHATLADVMRRYGYRTAAFYPPALFYVDEARFTGLRDRQLGFEYAKVMFASAEERVGQVAEYLDQVDGTHPLLLWVHLFEPHEPYESAPEFARGASAQARYDGEVAQADRAIGAILELVERRRGSNLVVVATADHGEEFGDHGGTRHGTTLFDEQVRVPLLVRASGVLPAGARVMAPADHVDVVTTLLSALGLPRDARMVGQDLSPLLLGAEPSGSLRAYASVDDERMVCDGRHKLICRTRGRCRLFDLQHDPRERHDLAAELPGPTAALEADLRAFASQLARAEVLELQGAAVPEVLARVHMGEAVDAEDLRALLSATLPALRAEAALACLQGVECGPLRAQLMALREHDPDATVRASAAVAAFHLGESAAEPQVQALLASAPSAPIRRMALLELARRGHREVARPLLGIVFDRELDEARRVEALAALASVADATFIEPLLPLRQEVRLRPALAQALGQIGGRGAASALDALLEAERYPEARGAEAEALGMLDRTAAVSHVVRFLGTEASLPFGLGLLERWGVLGTRVAGGRLNALQALRKGPFSCDGQGCRPGPRSSLDLSALQQLPTGPLRVVLGVAGHGGEPIQVGGRVMRLGMDGQVSVPLAGAAELALGAWPAAIELVAVVEERADVPPDPPEDEDEDQAPRGDAGVDPDPRGR